jgi:hypothetical protein
VRIWHSSKLRRQIGARFDASGARRFATGIYYPTNHHDTTWIQVSGERPTEQRWTEDRWLATLLRLRCLRWRGASREGVARRHGRRNRPGRPKASAAVPTPGCRWHALLAYPSRLCRGSQPRRNSGNGIGPGRSGCAKR